MANDLTKMFETIQRGTLTPLLQWLGEQLKLKCEFIVVIADVTKEERKGKEET